MPKQRLLIEVDGVPAPQGSKRHVGKGRMIESSKHLPLWRKRVTEAALGAMTEQPWDGALPALSMHIVFTLPRPKGHHRSVGGLRSPMLHGWAPQLHAAKPDLDKLLRAVGDALTDAHAYVDDARVCQVFAVKAYTSHSGRPLGVRATPGARIVLSPMGVA
jgi:Holliday junction resolvase RusA-like endonuclease